MKIKDAGQNAEAWIRLLNTAPDIESAAEQLGQLLDLPEPSPTAAVERALAYPLFARDLLAALHWVLTAPADARITDMPDIKEAEQTKAALATKQCPKRDANSPVLSLWGEPWEESAEPNEIWR